MITFYLNNFFIVIKLILQDHWIRQYFQDKLPEMDFNFIQ